MKVKCAHDGLVSIKKLIPHPKNRNKHPKEQIERLAKVLQYQGVRRPVRVSELSGYITAGHCLYEAAKLLKWKELPVDYQPYDSEDQEIADGIADNSIALWADLDFAGINMDVPGLGPDFDIDWLGIKDFVIEPADKIYMVDEDSMPTDDEVETTVKPGQIWQLGAHRIMCGDSTDKASVDALMNSEKADMVFTDPPYNVNFKYNSYDDTKVDYLKWKETCDAWLKTWLGLTPKIVLTPGCNNLELWARISEPTHIGCWIKTNANTTGRITHLWQWEPIFFIGKFERKRASDVFTHHVDSGFLRDETTGNHPCPKPVRLWQDIVENFSNEKDILFEPFCGSGTTIIACEKTNRKCYGMEIDPHYCDVIIARWEKYTGGKAILANG